LIRDIDHYLKASRCRPGPIRSAIELASSSGETGAQSLRRRSYPRRWSRSWSSLRCGWRLRAMRLLPRRPARSAPAIHAKSFWGWRQGSWPCGRHSRRHTTRPRRARGARSRESSEVSPEPAEWVAKAPSPQAGSDVEAGTAL